MDYDSLCAYLEGKSDARRDMPFGADTLVFKVMDKMFALVAWQAEPLTISLPGRSSGGRDAAQAISSSAAWVPPK